MTRLSDLAEDIVAGDLTNNCLTGRRQQLIVDVMATVDEVVADLATMDRDTTIELQRWPAAKRLVRLAGRPPMPVHTSWGAL